MDVVEIAIVGVGTVVIQPDGHGQLLVCGRKTPFRIDPRQPGENLARLRVGERLRRMAELCGGRWP
jgi:hypothetical protein